MKYLSITAILLSIFLQCNAQVDTNNISYIAYWSKGDSYNYRITKIKKRWTENKLTKNDSASYIATFSVIDSTADGYRIKWTHKADLSDFDLPTELKNKFSKTKQTEVIYKTDPFGTFIEIENWEEFSKSMNELLINLAKEVSKNGNEEKASLEEMIAPILTVFKSKQAIEQVVFKEIQLFHYPFGVKFSIREPLSYEEQFPNMLGGAPINATTKLYFETVDFLNAFSVLIKETKINPKEAKRLIVSVLKKMGIDNDMEKALKNSKIDIHDNNRFEYFYDSGVPFKIEAVREMQINVAPTNMQGIEIVRIELLAEE